jgi:branched-chain amino acid transport system substrate-binding protein
MSRRAMWVVVTLCLVVAACGTRVTEETGGSATSLVQRSTSDGGTATTVAADAVVGTDTGGTDGSVGTTGGSTGSATTGGTGSATTGGTTNRPASGAPIMLGAVGTKSGLIGNALEGGFRGLTVWEKWVNSHGGVQGRPVKIIQVDDAGDPGKHAAAVRKLIREDRVVAFIGNIAPFTLSAGMPLLEEAGVAAIGGDGGDATWFHSPNAFPINGQSVARSRPAARWAIAHLTQRKAAVFYVSEAEASTTLAQNFVDEYKKAGGQVIINAGVSLATPDFTGEVVQAQNSGADLVFILLEKAACNRFMDAAQRQGYKPIIIAPACTIDNARGHKALTTNRLYSATSVRSAVHGFTVVPAQDEALAAGDRYDPSLSLDGAFMFGWLAGKLFQEAMAQPGAVLTPKGIIDALHKLPATTLGGLAPSQSWPPGNHPEGRCGLISKFDGNNFILQTPDFLCA